METSNIAWSEKTLTDRTNRLMPENEFEFIIASSEYGFRKPDSLLFELALKKANLSADEVWYEELTIENPMAVKNMGLEIPFPHLHIHKWDTFVAFLEELLSSD